MVLEALVDRLPHDGRQRGRDGRPDLGGGARAQRHAGHVGVGDRHWAMGKPWGNNDGKTSFSSLSSG